MKNLKQNWTKFNKREHLKLVALMMTIPMYWIVGLTRLRRFGLVGEFSQLEVDLTIVLFGVLLTAGIVWAFWCILKDMGEYLDEV